MGTLIKEQKMTKRNCSWINNICSFNEN